MNYQQPIITGNTGGTPITQLRKDLINNDLDSNYSLDSIKTSSDIRKLVDEINNNGTNNRILNNIQNDKTDNKIDNDSYKSRNSIKSSNSNNSNNTVDTTDTTDTIDTEDTEDTLNTDDKNKSDKKKRKHKKNKSNIIEDSIYDGILLLIIFILMSQHFVKNFIGNYVKVINENDEGYVPITGIVSYGVIFVMVFLSARIFIHKIITL